MRKNQRARFLGHALEFLKDQYRHCKAILLLGAGSGVAEKVGLPLADESDWAITRDLKAFIAAVGKHRNGDGATDRLGFDGSSGLAGGGGGSDRHRRPPLTSDDARRRGSRENYFFTPKVLDLAFRGAARVRKRRLSTTPS